MVINLFQKGFNYSQDGPGNRLVYHLQGCNMKCPWCSNPEGMTVTPPLMATGNTIPTYVCTHGAVVDGRLHRERCIGCDTHECVIINKNTFLVCKNKAYDIDVLLEEILSCRPLFFDHGGVTLTGGEATMQFDAVKQLLLLLKANSVHTAIETNGTHPKLEELLPYIDYLIMDFKHYDTKAHQLFTGVSNEEIKNNFKKVINTEKIINIRIPLIHGVNADAEDIEGFISFFKPFPREKMTFEFLPYHEYGKDKWVQCGYIYGVNNGFVPKQTVSHFTQQFKLNGLHVIHT